MPLTKEEQIEFDELCNTDKCTPEKWNRHNELHKKSFEGATEFERCSDGIPYAPKEN